MKIGLIPQTGKDAFSFCTAVFLFIFACVPHCLGVSDTYENSQVLEAQTVLAPDVIKGPNHEVDASVQNDGFLNHYVLRSIYGNYEAVSTSELKERVREIKVISEMKKIDTASTIKESVVESGQKTVAGIKNIVLHPSDTVEGAVTGLGSLFNRAKEAVTSSPSQSEDSRIEQFIGFSASKRDIANKMGVDVYSANNALQSELDRLAWADYSGGIGMTAALSLVPGGAGTLVSVSGGARLLNEAINMTPPQELRKNNRQKLTVMDMNSDTIDLFINNTVFSPRHQTLIVAAMEKMQGASNKELILKVALQAHDRTMALIITQMALMFSGYHNRIEPIVRFFPIARVLYAKDKKGKVIVMLPADHILWSMRFADAVAEIKEKREGDTFELWIAGSVSKKAEDQLHRSGWLFHTDAWSRLEDTLLPKSQ